VKRTFQVQGHNDGMRVVGDDDLWALQNEDANPNLVVINLRTGQEKIYKFPPAPHGGGYDDMVVKNGSVFISASNPTLDTQDATASRRWCAPHSRATRCCSSQS
jgi:hypothetical protein